MGDPATVFGHGNRVLGLVQKPGSLVLSESKLS